MFTSIFSSQEFTKLVVSDTTPVKKKKFVGFRDTPIIKSVTFNKILQ